jgi:hypothetical protein
MDTAQTAIHHLEAMETRQVAVPKAMRTGSESEPGPTNGWERSRPMASGPQSGNAICVSKQLLRLTWTSKAVRWEIAQSIRTAGCGPARAVAWEGRRGDSPPYPDLVEKSATLAVTKY